MARLIELDKQEIGISFVKNQNGPLVQETIVVENVSLNVVQVTFPTTIPGVEFSPQTFILNPRSAPPGTTQEVKIIYNSGILNGLPVGRNTFNFTVSSKAVTTTPNKPPINQPQIDQPPINQPPVIIKQPPIL